MHTEITFDFYAIGSLVHAYARMSPRQSILFVARQYTAHLVVTTDTLAQKLLYHPAMSDLSDYHLTNATLQAEGLEATYGILTKVSGRSSLGNYHYEPTIFVGTHKISAEQKLELFLVGHILDLLQNKPPMNGRIVGGDGKSHRVKLENSDKTCPCPLNLYRRYRFGW